jgi:hypothetical protein
MKNFHEWLHDDARRNGWAMDEIVMSGGARPAKLESAFAQHMLKQIKTTGWQFEEKSSGFRRITQAEGRANGAHGHRGATSLLPEQRAP